MDFNWLTVNKLFDPGTSVGAITLAIVFIVAAWAACVVTTRLVQRASCMMGSRSRPASFRLRNSFLRSVRIRYLTLIFWGISHRTAGNSALINNQTGVLARAPPFPFLPLIPAFPRLDIGGML